MAHSRTAQKRIRQNLKRRALNRWRLRTMRAALKDFADKIAHGSADEAKAAYLVCQKVIDRTAQRGTIHKNQAARRKSRLVAKLKIKQGVTKSAAPTKPAAKKK
jgi:small subunit ribosomal protein S20